MTEDARPGPNADLVGRRGSRSELMTPALVLDLDVFEANIATMADHCREQGVLLRPHSKTHKCVEVARAQIAAGAVGICCAKPGEAEAMAAGGIESILITSPVVQDGAIGRIFALNLQIPDLAIVVDNSAVLERIAASADPNRPLNVFVDLDVGTRRTGVSEINEAVELARTIQRTDGLIFRGVQAYAGHLQHVEAYAERKTRSEESLAHCQVIVDAMSASGVVPEVVTGGGTGTFDIDPATGVLTELQGGSYIFMDRQYNDVDLDGSIAAGANRPPFGTSLAVQTTVISANQKGFVTTDAGFKAFAMDGPRPDIMAGAPEGASYRFMGDEHGCVIFESEGNRMEVGDTLTAMTPHCDPTVNLYDAYHCVRGDTLVDIWPIQGRGKSA